MNREIQIFDVLNIQPEPEHYILDEPLQKAVEMALRFNQPLLLTGEPGTGKTQLAFKVAHQLHKQTEGNAEMCFAPTPLRFNTKTTSQARDLFYIYDAIGHFQQANTRRTDAGKEEILPLANFIELQALGKAIALANPNLKEYRSKFKFDYPDDVKPSSSVVLIDEVDKAPRDFTNDILNEIENREFFVKEQDNYHIGLDLGLKDDKGKDTKNTQRILIIMTSNSEKNLPEAFLRRCVFYNIPTPKGEPLRKILKEHLSKKTGKALDANLKTITEEFEQLREKVTRKKPATAELVAVVKLLALEDKFFSEAIKDVKAEFRDNLSLLVKTREDIEALREFLEIP
ncbi:MAG: AAA family ATPase [Phycisphaerae bacterium]|nr:AAA family ATPase [Saprospiraceae bacterium]